MRSREIEPVGVVLLTAGSYAFIDDWLAPAAVVVLWLCVRLTRTNDRIYALPLAMGFQWTQSSLGIFYCGLTGRPVPAIHGSDYRPMVMIALGCCLALAGGIKVGLLARPFKQPKRGPDYAFKYKTLVVAYVVSIFLEGSLLQVAPYYSTIRQILTTLDTARLGILFLLLRRLCSPQPRWSLITAIMGVEVVLGITGFFAGFREPLILAALAILEVFNPKNRQHWTAVTVSAIAAVLLGLLWMGIRNQYRQEYSTIDTFSQSRGERINRVRDLTTGFVAGDASDMWATADELVDRMWVIYYPALALERVPKVLPHTGGAILGAALKHIVTPRVLFPDKPELPSDSDSVRKYSNVQVAGRERNTTIAFGYAIESYIDFGVPLMFVPVFAFGMLVGAAYAAFRDLIWHRELFVAFATVTFWLSVYLFERSWAMMLGTTMSLLVYLGPLVIVLDRFLLDKPKAIHPRPQPAAVGALMQGPR